LSFLVLSASYTHSPAPFPRHFHDCHQLIYVRSGSSVFTIGEKTYDARPGTLLLISRFEQHSALKQSDDYARFNLQIAPDAQNSAPFSLQPLLSVLVNRPGHFSHAADMSGCSQMEELLFRLVEETQSPSALCEEMQNLLFFQLLILLCRRYPNLIAGGGRQLQQISQVQQFLQENLARKVTLEELSHRFHVSASHLSHLFKALTGQSVMEYLFSCRLAAAKNLLTQTDWPVSHIVESCGFTDNSNFSRSFRAAEGLTPSEFRKLLGRHKKNTPEDYENPT